MINFLSEYLGQLHYLMRMIALLVRQSSFDMPKFLVIEAQRWKAEDEKSCTILYIWSKNINSVSNIAFEIYFWIITPYPKVLNSIHGLNVILPSYIYLLIKSFLNDTFFES